MMVDDVMFASGSDRWATPQLLFDQISEVFGPFDLDPCAEAWNAKAEYYLTEAHNGLGYPWFIVDEPGHHRPANVFVNPPFSRNRGVPVEPWINKAWDEVQSGNAFQVVMLIPARTETRIWHDVIWPHAAVIAFIKGRINFVRPDGATGPAPFPSAIVVFRQVAGAGALPKQQLVIPWEQLRTKKEQTHAS